MPIASSKVRGTFRLQLWLRSVVTAYEEIGEGYRTQPRALLRPTPFPRIRKIAETLGPLSQMFGEVLREALSGISVAVVCQTARNETMVEKLHLAPLELLAHVDPVSPERMGKRHHVSDRSAPMGLGERDLAGKREIFLRAAPAASDGVLDEPMRDLIDMLPVGSRHPGDGACARSRVRYD